MFSLIIPVYNEQKSLPFLFTKLAPLCSQNIEIIFINDASQDGCYELLEEFKKTNNTVKVIHLSERKGQGRCLIHGIKASSQDILISMDSDLQNDISDVFKLYNALIEGNYSIVCGNRLKHLYNLGLSKAFFSISLNIFLRILFGLKIKDSTGGMKAFKKSTAIKILNNFYIDNFHRYLPLLTHLYHEQTHEIPISLYKRKYGRSNYIISKSIFNTIRDILKIIIFATKKQHIKF